MHLAARSSVPIHKLRDIWPIPGCSLRDGNGLLRFGAFNSGVQLPPDVRSPRFSIRSGGAGFGQLRLKMGGQLCASLLPFEALGSNLESGR
jgi:hypothetical protein